MTIKYT